MGQTVSKEMEWIEHQNVETPAWNVVDDMDLLRRFLYLGTDTMYSPSHVDPEQKYADLINRLIKEGRGKEVVQLIALTSYSEWVPRQNYIIFALAVCARSDDMLTKKLAYGNMCQICHIPVNFFMFVNYCQLVSGQSQPPSKGWGRAHRRAVFKWYEEKSKDPEGLARLLTKYKPRKMAANERKYGKYNKWSHRDIFRLGHLSSDDILMKVVREFVLYGFEEAKDLASEEKEEKERKRCNDEAEMHGFESVTKFLTYIEGTIKAKQCNDEAEMVHLIKMHGFEKEHDVPTRFMYSKSVLDAIIKNMKPKAKIRSVRMISARGLCGEDSVIEKEIIETISNPVDFQLARVHPIKILSTLATYAKGKRKDHSKRREIKEKWFVNKSIVKALYEAYELSFRNVQHKGKRYLLAVDVSKNMNVPCRGCPAVMCNQAAATMMMITARTEPECQIFGFSGGLTRIHMDKKDTLSQTMEKMNLLSSGTTDSTLPMRWAEQNKKKIDLFIVYTDKIPTDRQTPSKALEKYRATMKKPEAKLIVVAMASNPYAESVATGLEKAMTRDYREINIVGFDVHAAILIAKFIQDEL